jgi:hypothetical protein
MPKSRLRMRLLKEIFTRNAYSRVPNEERRKEGQKYKKGYEVRFVVKTEDELKELRELLKKAGLTPARPFQKAKQVIQPVYGKQAIEYFVRFLKSAGGPE